MFVQKGNRTIRYWPGWLLAPVLMALALCGALIVGRGRLYWGPVESDLINSFYPYHAFVHRWFMRGVWPFWDPHVFGGYPALETQQMLALNPVHLISLLLPSEWGLPLEVGVHTVIGAAGMAWALWRWGRCSALGAALGAVTFVAGSLFAVRMAAGHLTVVAALAWWPLAALSVLRLSRAVPTGAGTGIADRTKDSVAQAFRTVVTMGMLRRTVALSIVAHAMVLLAGGPQYVVYLFYMDLAIWLVATRRWAWGGSLGLLAAVWVCAVFISAPQWLPALWYLPYSARAGGSSGNTGLDFGPLLNLILEGVMPYPFGDDVAHGHLHFKNAWETATYPGALAVLFAVTMLLRWLVWAACHLFQRATCRVAISPMGLAGLAIFAAGIYMVVGGWLPGFGGFRDVTKARAVVAFGVAILAAVQLDSLLRPGGLVAKFCYLGALVTMGAVYLGWAMGYADVERFKQVVTSFGAPFDSAGSDDYWLFLTDPRPAAGRYQDALQMAILVGIIIPAILFGLLVFSRRSRMVGRIVAPLFVAVAIFDLVSANGDKWLGQHEWERARLPLAVENFFGTKLAESQKDFPWRVLLHPGIINKTHHMEGLFEYRGYDPLMPSRSVNRMMVKGLRELQGDEQFAQRSGAMARAGVRYNAETWLPGKQDVATSGIQEVPGASLFEVTREVVAGSPGSEIYGPDLTGKHYVMPAEAGGQIRDPKPVSESFARDLAANLATPGPVADNGETSVPLETGRPDEYGIKVNLASPAIVIYKGTWLPGWHVVVDGEDKGQALFANNWMCGALVGAGEHEVVFRYRPVGWLRSWVLCVLGTGVLVATLLWPEAYPQQNKPRQDKRK